VLLFGSHAAGTASEESDIDIIIVSDAFRGVPFIRRMTMVLKMARFPRHIDYLCYTPEEFGRISRTSVILQDALTYAIELPGDQTKLIGTVK
jgi:predicted nucleotidyltransferase